MHLLEISICNAHILYEKVLQKQISGLEFRKKLICQLIHGYKIVISVTNDSALIQRIDLNFSAIKIKDIHGISIDKEKFYLKCKICNCRTIYLYPKCNVHLCPEHHLQYHIPIYSNS